MGLSAIDGGGSGITAVADVGLAGTSQPSDVYVPGIVDVSIGGAELGHLLDGGSACAPGFDGPTLEVDVLNSGHLIDAHVSGIADANVDLGELNWNSDCGC